MELKGDSVIIFPGNKLPGKACHNPSFFPNILQGFRINLLNMNPVVRNPVLGITDQFCLMQAELAPMLEKKIMLN